MASITLPEGTVTLLFTDVEGSTAMRTGRGDDAAHVILKAHEALVREQIAEHSGQEIKALGDGFMVGFASARKAVACAVGIQRSMDQHARQNPDGHAKVRIGLNSGEVVQENGDLMGASVNLAARIMAKADGGQILVSGVVKDLAGVVPDASFVNRGRFRLKGFPERWQLFEVLWKADEEVAVPQVVDGSPFVGRQAERAELMKRLNQAREGRGGLVMIGGEPGIGKTRLTDEIAVEAHKLDFRALTGHCIELEGALPYMPFVELLEAAIKEIDPETLRAALGDAAPEVARILPRLRRIFPDIPPPLELPPEQQRRFLFNSVQEFIARGASIRPQLVILDDLHWADESTLLLLQHLAESLADMPVLVLATYRDVDLDVSRPLARTLEDFLRRRLAHRISLRRMDVSAVGEMLKALAGGRDAPPRLVDIVFGETEGNPFFVEEVFQHLNEEGRLFDARGDWKPDIDVSEVDVPEGIRLVLGRRLERLSEEARKGLMTAAAIGRAFTYRLLEEASDLDPDTLLDGVDAAERARLITAVDEGAEASFVFSHELIRQTLLANLSLPRRQRLHLRVAEAMEKVFGEAADDHATEIAEHMFMAGEAAEAAKVAHYLALAGDRAMEAAAYEEARGDYERALAAQPTGDPRAHAEILSKVGRARMSVGQWEPAMEAWNGALDEFEAIGEGQTVAALCRELAWLSAWRGAFIQAMGLASRGLTAGGDDVSRSRALILSMSSLMYSAAGGYELGRDMMKDALQTAQQLGDDSLVALIKGDKSVHLWQSSLSGADLALEAAPILRESRQLLDLAQVLAFARTDLLWSRRIDDAEAVAPEAWELARRLEHHGALFVLHVGDFILAFGAGRLDEAQLAIEHHFAVCRAAGLPWYRDSYTMFGLLAFARGDWEEAIELVQQGEPYDFPWGAGMVATSVLFMLLAYSGREAEALQLLPPLMAEMPLATQPGHWGGWTIASFVAEGLLIMGRLEEAASLHTVIAGAIQHSDWFYRAFDWMSFESVAGLTAAAAEEWDLMEEHFQLAAQDVVPGADRLAAEIARLEALGRLRRGTPDDKARVAEILPPAIATYEGIGMPRHAAMCEELLAQES